MIFFLMIRQPPRSTRTDTLFPYTTLFRSKGAGYNVNLPLPETITPEQYREALQSALKRIERHGPAYLVVAFGLDTARGDPTGTWRSEEHTSELQSLMRISYAVFCLKKKKKIYNITHTKTNNTKRNQN